MMDEFIVAYRSDEINVRAKNVDVQFCHCQMSDMYDFALSLYPEYNYGDIIPWNNQFWGIVRADNAANALLEFMRLISQRSPNGKDDVKENATGYSGTEEETGDAKH